ncbi:hypothetical protein [Pontibacter toksunensis]|uniref:hypothetical protein n=1 Tax=Pontibacter toksunensis TaxID=1332631 RepID=UPI00366FEAA2
MNSSLYHCLGLLVVGSHNSAKGYLSCAKNHPHLPSGTYLITASGSAEVLVHRPVISEHLESSGSNVLH